MAIAALYDIHGNLPALEAVLTELAELDIDTVVIGGDVTLGPLPRETLDRLRELDLPTHWIRGNCELAVHDELRKPGSSRMPPPVSPVLSWVAGQLGEQDVVAGASWPRTVTLEVDGVGRVLFCHATPRDEHPIFTEQTPAERLLPMLEGIEADVVVCGHTHMQFDRTVAGVRVVNAGSIGMPFGRRGAHWLLLGPDVDLRRTRFDVEAAAQRLGASTSPGAPRFLDDLRDPPSRETMLERFARAELGAG